MGGRSHIIERGGIDYAVFNSALFNSKNFYIEKSLVDITQLRKGGSRAQRLASLHSEGML